MSDISGLSAGNGSGLVDYLNANEKNKSSVLDSSSAYAQATLTLERGTSARRQNATQGYALSASSELGQAALKRAISEMQSKTDGPITFTKIAEYQKTLEESFSVAVRVALAKKGVDPGVDFTLNMNAEGEIEVSCTDAVAKQKIQKYLSENKSVCEEFGYIQALANLSKATQSPAASMDAWRSVQNTKATFQAQAIDAFFSNALDTGMNYANMMASFTPTETPETATAKFYTGVSYKV